MTATADVTRGEAWLMAARPQTLPAGAAPVVMGVGLAVADGVFAPVPALAALLGALLIQVGTNLANDYYDAVKGTDAADREGFTRVTAGGLIEPRRVKLAMIATYGLAMAIGVYIAYVGGVPILVAGLASVAAGILYTGGPYPYGYYGLGDLFVFVFFGLVAVAGTYYVQAVPALGAGTFPITIPAGTVTAETILAGVAAGALSTAILVVNNIRDIESDREAGKRTLAVLLGYRWSRVEFVTLCAAGYLVPPALWLAGGYPPSIMLTYLTLPLAAVVTRTLLTRTDGEALNTALERTGQVLAVYALLFALGIGLPGVS
jgi:1,4-dihydroxy-2-naphthoate octaprenyltransferase